MELDVDRDLAARRHGRGQRDPRDGAVVGVVVVRVLEGERRQEILAGRELHGGDLGPAPAVLLGPVATELAAGLDEEGAAVVAEGVPVEVEPEIGDGIRGVGRGIPPDDALAAGELLLLGVELHRDVVGDDPVGVLRKCAARAAGRARRDARVSAVARK